MPGPPAGANPNFYLTLSSKEIRLIASGTTTITVTFASATGTLGQITPSLGTLPPGVTAFFYPASPSLSTVVDGHSVASATLYLASDAGGTYPQLDVSVGATLSGGSVAGQTLSVDAPLP